MNSPRKNLTLLTWIIYCSIVGSSVPVLWMWLHPDSFSVVGDLGVLARYGGMETLQMWQRIAGFLVCALPQTFLIYALWQLLKILEPIKQGDWFFRENERQCTQIGRAMLWYVLFHWLNDTFLILIITATYDAGQKQLVISISNQDVLGLVPALMAFVIAQLLRLAREQREELNEII